MDGTGPVVEKGTRRLVARSENEMAIGVLGATCVDGCDVAAVEDGRRHHDPR